MNLSKFLKFYLIFGSVFILIDGLIHFFPIRLTDVLNFWPEDAYQYARFFNQLYGSFAIFIAGILFISALDLKKYKLIILFAAFFALFHALILLYNAMFFNFDLILKAPSSLTFWIPFYRLFEIFEAILLIGFTVLVFFWKKYE